MQFQNIDLGIAPNKTHSIKKNKEWVSPLST